MFEKVVKMDSPKEFSKAHKENVASAKEKTRQNEMKNEYCIS